MNYSFEGYDIGRFIASTLISRYYKDHRLNTIKYAKAINTELRVALSVKRAFEILFDELVPGRVVIFNGRFTQMAPVVQLCNQRGIEYVTHDRGGVLDRYVLVWNNYVHDLPTHLADIEKCWLKGKEGEREIVGRKWFQDRQGHVIQSWMPFAKHQKKGYLPENFNPSKKNISIFNSTLEEYIWYDEFQNPVYENELEAISEIASSFKDNTEFDIYLRIHPNLKNLPPHKNSQIRYLFALKGKYPNFHIINPESTIDSYALIKNSEKIISFGSTVGVEACFMEKPVILIGRAFYENLGCCYRPTTHQEVMELMLKKLEPKGNCGAIKYGYWEMRRGIPFNYFKPTGVFTGYFMGHTLSPSLKTTICALIMECFEIRSTNDLINFLRNAKRMILMRWL